MSYLNEVQRMLADDMSESPNTPNPLRISPWGEDRVLGIVLPNMARFSNGGIEIPGSLQAIPSACQIVKVSDRITADFPKLQRIKEQHDPDGEGKLFDGPIVAYNPAGVGTWTYTCGCGENLVFAILHANSIRGDYTPYYKGAQYSFDEKEAA